MLLLDLSLSIRHEVTGTQCAMCVVCVCVCEQALCVFPVASAGPMAEVHRWDFAEAAMGTGRSTKGSNVVTKLQLQNPWSAFGTVIWF